MPKAMLSDIKSYTFKRQKLCFPTLKAMLTAFKSYAYGLQELCSALSRAMFHNIQDLLFMLSSRSSFFCSGRFVFKTSLLLWRCPAISCKVSGWTAASGPVFRTRRFAFAIALICSAKLLKKIEGCNSGLQILTHGKWKCGPKHCL